MSTPAELIKKKLRKPWGWGPEGDQENPLSRLGKRVAQDAKETVYDLKEEPAEVPYRLKERLKSYFGMPRSPRR